jgi:F-type H+-transporting ATPase subunit b
VLKKLLFNRVSNLIEKRTKSISDSLESAKIQNEEAEATIKKAEETLASAREEASQIIEDARLSGKKEYDDIMKDARHEATELIHKTTEAMEKDRSRMMREIYDQIVRLSLEAASRVVEDNMDTERSRKIVERILEEEGLSR